MLDVKRILAMAIGGYNPERDGTLIHILLEATSGKSIASLDIIWKLRLV